MVFAKPKIKLVRLRRRSKTVKRLERRKERFHSWKTSKAYDEYYKAPEN
jgi:hypothetical protein